MFLPYYNYYAAVDIIFTYVLYAHVRDVYVYLYCYFLLWQGRMAVANCWSLNHKSIIRDLSNCSIRVVTW